MMAVRSAFATAAWWTFGILFIAFMLSPLFLVVLFSLGENSNATLPLGGFTTKWYQMLFASSEFWDALHSSLIVTPTVGVISTLTGTMAALGLTRWRSKASAVTMQVITLPVMLPPLVLGLALATAGSSAGFSLGLHTVVLGHLIFTQPFVILIVYAQMVNFDYSVVDSARDLGASPLKVFFTVVLPILRPTLIGAALIAMAISIDDFIITFFTIGGGMTLPTLVWGMLRTSLDPSINALGALILAASVCASSVALWITQYRG